MVNPDQQQNRGIYLLPNLFTTAGLFAGFYAIVAAIRGDFATAAVAIFVAMIMDGLDGRIARLTNTPNTTAASNDTVAGILIVPMICLHLIAQSSKCAVSFQGCVVTNANLADRVQSVLQWRNLVVAGGDALD